MLLHIYMHACCMGQSRGVGTRWGFAPPVGGLGPHHNLPIFIRSVLFCIISVLEFNILIENHV